ncbi:MAG: hypothetical protein NTW37_04935 [Proteobacteria bacterium]|nr:hypothetical protein [Pseudomonadota bacterium]
MAGWDAFLTVQDKQHLAVWGKKANDGFGERPVLLVVDVFHAALGHERKPILESIRDWPVSRATSGCVRAAVVDAVTYRYRVGVVGECCFDRTQASHWINLFDMHQKYADVVDVAAATDYFAAVAGRHPG